MVQKGGVGLFDALTTLRAIRRFKPTPIGDEDVRTLMEMAVMAPSGRNTQPWEFIVVRRGEVKERLKPFIVEAWRSTIASLPPATEEQARIYKASTRMVENTENTPALIFACVDLRRAAGRRVDPRRMGWYPSLCASIYPAVQNLMLAARGLGLGSCLTTAGLRREADLKRILGVPEHVRLATIIYLGYPEAEFAKPRRLPVQRLVHHEAW